MFVKNATGFIMSFEETCRCVEDEEYKKTALARQMRRYPKAAADANRRINDLFSQNPKYKDIPEAERKELIDDILFCRFGYGFQIDEYVFFELGGINKGKEERADLVSDAERLAFRFCANDFSETIYADKASAYSILKPFFHREAVAVESVKDREKVIAFAKRHESFVQKIVNSSRGQGVQLVNMKDFPGGAEEYYKTIENKGKLLLEELIVQSDQMKQFNPDSVNTVRLSTFYTRDGVEAPFGFFRTGRKGSFIDNCATGGVFSTIDTALGEVCSDSCDEFGNRYAAHPDSGVVLKGFKLPDWDKALELCKNAALLTPNLKYLSWDLAYSDKYGWDIVEVNTSGQFMQQAGSLTGIRKELKKLIDNMDLLIPYTIRG